ncbi:MAG: thioesterase family protein [Gemmatimonadaceae bacterium]
MSSNPRPFLSNDRVRWADVDLVGIMRFSAFTRLVENGEQDLWREAGLPYGNVLTAPETWMPRRNLNIEYTAPARIDEALLLATYVSRLGDTSLTFNVDVMSVDRAQLIAAATVVTVCVNAADWSKRSLSPELRAAMAPYAVRVDDARVFAREHMAVGAVVASTVSAADPR